MNTYATVGKKVVRVAVFFDTPNIIYEHLHDTLIWDYFTSIPDVYKEMLYVEAVTPNQIWKNILMDRNFDVIVMPGGDAEDNYSYLGEDGRKKICEFVSEYGRGYVGICAGCYLALSPNKEPIVKDLIKKGVLDYKLEKWHWGLVPELTSSDLQHWKRGTGEVSVSLTKFGMKILNTRKLQTKVYFANGAIMKSSEAFKRNIIKNSRMNVVAIYTSEIKRFGVPEGKMISTPAIVVNEYGKRLGRVAISSCHIEKYPKDHDSNKFLVNLLIWASKVDIPLIN